MTIDEFRATLSAAEPPAVPILLRALWYDARGDWSRAHTIAQEVDDAGGAWLHAYLKPFSSSPLALTTVSSALDLWQVVKIKRIQRKRPRLAVAWATGLVALEVWATTNNISAAGRIQQLRRHGPNSP